LEVIVDGMLGSTGLELKVDPGVPYVYAGFGGMMITTLLSYISHSQVPPTPLPTYLSPFSSLIWLYEM
jgi:cytochrome c biogenesis protein ResB